jgi:hypothetical protein
MDGRASLAMTGGVCHCEERGDVAIHVDLFQKVQQILAVAIF